jgi:hypothetical protein
MKTLEHIGHHKNVLITVIKWLDEDVKIFVAIIQLNIQLHLEHIPDDFIDEEEFKQIPQLTESVETGGIPIFPIEHHMLDGIPILGQTAENIILSPVAAHQLYKKVIGRPQLMVDQVGKYITNNKSIIVEIAAGKYINWGYYIGFHHIINWTDQHIQRVYDAEANYSEVPLERMQAKHWQIYADIMNLKSYQRELAKQWVKLMAK